MKLGSPELNALLHRPVPPELMCRRREARPRSGVGEAARIRLAALVAPGVFRAVGRSLRYDVVGLDHLREARARSPDGRVIFCCWHGSLLPLLYLVRDRGMRILVSRHRDGEMLARLAARLGFRPIRGSTRRGGAQALLEAIRVADPADLAITPDGPRGPAGRFHAGAILLAQRSALPIVPVGCGVERAWRVRSWDALQVPLPFSRVRVVCAAPLTISSRPGGLARERSRAAAERALAAATVSAEFIRSGGRSARGDERR